MRPMRTGLGRARCGVVSDGRISHCEEYRFFGVNSSTIAVLALVLGPLAERSMRQSLIGSRGDAFTFIDPVEHPIALGCIVVAFLLMLYPVFLSFRKNRAKAAP